MNETQIDLGCQSVSAGGAAHRSSLITHRSRRARQAGFSLIELIVVVTIIGILAGLAIINVQYGVRKAQEAALRDNLATMRRAIDNFYADKQHYPADLNELVPNYIRKIPPDPILKAVDWETVIEDPLSLEGGEMSAETDPNAMSQPGVTDVKSKAEGQTLDGTPYNEL